MRRPAASFALAACAAAAMSCGGAETSLLDLRGLDITYGFLALVDADGHPTRLTAPFGIRDERLVFGSLPVISLVGGESNFVLIGFDDSDVERSAGGFQLMRASEIAAHLSPPPNIPQREQKVNGTVLTRGLPEGAKLYSGALNTGLIDLAPADEYRETIFREISLEFPIDAEYCRVPEQTPLGPFTDQVNAFSRALSVKPNVHEMRWLDPQRLFVATWTGVAVLEPGQLLEPGTQVLLLSEGEPTPIEGEIVFSGDVDPSTRSSTISTLALVGANMTEKGSSKIWEIEIRGTDLFLRNQPETMQLLIGEIAILHDGRQFVTSNRGEIYSRNPDTGILTPFVTLPTAVTPELQYTHLRAVDDERYPMIAATQGRVHLYDDVSGRFTYVELYQGGAGALDRLDFNLLRTSHTPDGELEIWAGAERNSLFRKIGSNDWEKLSLQFPPRFFPCVVSDDDTGELYYPGIWWDAALTRDYAHLIPKECSALIQVRRSDLCVSVLPQHDLPVQNTRDYLVGIDALEGHLAVGGDHGRTYRSAW